MGSTFITAPASAPPANMSASDAELFVDANAGVYSYASIRPDDTAPNARAHLAALVTVDPNGPPQVAFTIRSQNTATGTQLLIYMGSKEDGALPVFILDAQGNLTITGTLTQNG